MEHETFGFEYFFFILTYDIDSTTCAGAKRKKLQEIIIFNLERLFIMQC